MPKKKKGKQNISSSAAVIAPIEQTTALQRKYHFEDLSSDIIQKISKDHIETFNQLLTEINQSSDLSPRLQNKVRAMIAEFEKTLGLFYTDEKLKNFDAIFNDTDYFKTSYFNKLGTLYLKLNQKDKAKAYLHRSLLECRHPILIQNLALMLAEGLIQVGEEDYFTYLWHVILCHDLVRGTSHTRAMIEKMYEYFQAGSKVQALEVFSNKLYNHYLKNNNHEAVAELINFLSKSSSDFLKSCAANLLKAYITFYMSSSNFDQIDKLLVEFQTLVSSEHYKVITTFITHQLVLNKLSQKLLIKYLQKNVELGDIQAHMSLALILIEEPTSANEDPERGLKLVKNVQLLLKSKKGEEFDRIRGYCFYLIGKIYDRGLLP